MSFTLCPSTVGLDKDERFQTLKKVYRDRKMSDYDLLISLQVFREKEDLDIDWYPEDDGEDGYKLFTNFLDAPKRKRKKSMVTKESVNELYAAMTSMYSPKERDYVLDMISSIFSKTVDNILANSTFGVTRQQAINRQGTENQNGFNVLLDRVFSYIEKMGTIEAQEAWFDRRNPGTTQAEKDDNHKWLVDRAEAFKKISDNKEALQTLAAIRIGRNEGFRVNIDGFGYDFSQKEKMEPLEPGSNEDGSDTEEAQKGDRYDDVRGYSLMSTVSTRARAILSNLQMMDRDGKVIRNYPFGEPEKVNQRQAVIALHKILRTATPETLMTNLHNAVSRYPWMRSLIAYLEAHPEDKALVYTAFKKARASYYYAHKDNRGQLIISQINNVADGSSLSREAGSNLSSNIVLGEKYSITGKKGKLISNDDIKAIRKAIDAFSDFSKKNLKLKPVSNEEANKKWTTQNAAADWEDMINQYSKSDFEELTNVLRGLGFTLDSEDVKYALANSAPINSVTGSRKGSDVTPQTTSADRIVTALNEICRKAEYINDSENDTTGYHLYNYAKEEYKDIANILSAAQTGEVEERSISMNKSLSASVNPSALRELTDKLSNVANISDKEYKEMLIRDFGQYEGMALGFGDNLQLVGWLSDLYNDGNDGSDASFKNIRKSFQVIDLEDINLGKKNKTFAQMSHLEHLTTSYVAYMHGVNKNSGLVGHMYEMPIQSDYETAYNFIIAPSYSYSELVERFTQEVECEAQRIIAIAERQKNDPKEKGADPIRAIDITYEGDATHPGRGKQFQIFPEMNNNTEFIQRYSESDPTTAHEIAKQEVDKQLRAIIESEHKKLVDSGFFKSKNMKLLGIKSATDKTVNEWLLNSLYARQQITKLMFGGIEHFKSLSDYEKRNMYSHAQRLPMYTEATYNGNTVGKKNQNVLYLGDDVTKSAVYDQISANADKLYEQHKVTAEQRDRMKQTYLEITSTDGQGLRILDSAREVKIMAGIWTDEDELAYKHIISGDYTPEDVEHFMVGIKPAYTGYEILPAQPGKHQKPVRVPVLHKYSEMILLPDMLKGIDPQTTSAPLQALNKINEALGDNKIDLFLFGSGVKVGANSVIDVFAKDEKGNRILKDSDAIAKYVTDRLNKGSFWIHSLPYANYGITSSMHDNVVDTKIAWATQAQKEAWGNIDENEMLPINGKGMRSVDARELFYRIKTAMTIDTFKRINELLADKNEVARILKEELATKEYQSSDLLFALQLRDSGKFMFPLFSPNIQYEATSLLASIVKKRFTKVPTKGANMVQTTSFGLDYESEQTAFDDSLESSGFTPLEVKFDEDGKFKYVEAYLPIYDSRLFKYADKNGNITPKSLNKLVKDGVIPESILNFIAYRTPSDAEHSVIPCRIKGFINTAAGPSIRLPREIMKMTGHDYDGDKMRCHFKEFYSSWNEDELWREYEKFRDSDAFAKMMRSNTDPTLTPYKVFKRQVTSDMNPNAEKFRGFREVKYDYDKDPLDNIGENGSYSALNNAMVDLLFAQLTSENGGLKMFIPGGAAETAIYADEIGSRKQEQALLSPFLTTHATDSHDYMMEGANMIGTYAMYNSAAAMYQRLNLKYIPKKTKNGDNIPVSLFGKAIAELYPILSDGTFTTLGMSRLINAAVDNGKDPLLGYLNQTQGLAPMTNFLLAAGLQEKEVHLIFNQPVMKELANRMKTNNETFSQAASSVMDNLIQALVGKDRKNPYYTEDSIAKVSHMNYDRFKRNLNKSFNDMLANPDSSLQDQLFILQTINHLNSAAQDLAEFVRLTRPESDRGGIDASIGGIIAKIIQLDNFRERFNSDSDDAVHISGMENVVKYRKIYENSMTPKLIEQELGTDLPEVVALNSLMKDSILRMLREYFPQARESWLRIEKRLANQYIKRADAGTIDRIGQDMILWKLLSNNAFITGNPQEEQERILKDVPKQLRALKRRIEEAKINPGKDAVADMLKDNMFIQNLDLGTTIGANNEEISRIRFRLNGNTLEDTVDTIRYSWDQMLRTGDAEITKLATDLFKYNMYTNGFSYGRYEFSHFAPVSVMTETPGYLSALNEVLKSNWSDDEEEQFYHQFLMNHWGDDGLMKTYKPDRLPVNLRQQLGFNLKVKNPELIAQQFNDEVKDKDYIIVRTVNNNQAKDTLYRLIKDDNNIVVGLEEAQKLGIKNKNGQVIVQYNPRIRDYKEVRPVFTSNDVAWESNAITESASNEEAEEAASQEAKDNYNDDFNIHIPTAKTVEEVEKQASAAVNHNNSIIPSGKNGALSAEDLANLGVEGFYEEEEPIKQTSDNSNKLYHLVERDENGNPVTKSYPETPDTIRRAREQKVFIELNKRLRELLREYGISVGVLEEAEARLMAGGVTDFDAAKVLGEGMKELIRISNGMEGEYALPEEFAHIAIRMLGLDHPLVQRLLNTLRNNEKVLEEAFDGNIDRYREVYGDDQEKLIEEAAGKLVAKQLFQHQMAKTAPVRNLITRICDAIKSLFRKMSLRKVENAIYDAEGIASQLARDLLSGKLADEMSLEKITESARFYKLDKDLSNKKDIISKMLKSSLDMKAILERRLKYARKNASEKSINALKLQIAKVETNIEKQKLENVVADYLRDALDFMKNMEKSVSESVNNSSLNGICKKLSVVKDSLAGFSEVNKAVRDAIASGELEADPALKSILNETTSFVEEYWANYDKLSKMYLGKFLSNVYGEEGVTITIGKNRGKKITIDDMLNYADHDVSFFTRWLHAAADADDFIIQAVDEITKEAKANARRRVAELKTKLDAAVIELRKEQGNLDQSWIFERIKGKRTGRYISEEKAQNLSPAQYNFYTTFMELKREADRVLPDMLTSDRKMIMFRKQHYEKMKEAQGIKGKANEFWEYAKSGVLEMEEDNFENEEDLRDFQKSFVDYLPIKFLNKTKNETYDDMTEDAASSLLTYMGMAFEYQEMNNVIGIIENARYASSLRKVNKKSGLRQLVKRVGNENELHYSEPVTVRQADTNIQDMLNDYIHMHVYGNLRKDEGTFGNTRISKRKVADKLMGYSSLTQMGFNIHQRIANVNTGFTNIVVEVGGGNIKIKDIAWAQKVYIANTGDRLAETGKLDYNNKLSLWLDKFDIHQDNGKDIRNAQYGKSRISKVFNRNILYSGLAAGEDFLAATTALAYARNFKVKGPDGKESNMWDAYEVKFLKGTKKNKKGKYIDGEGAYLVLKEGYTNLDGSPITEEDENKFAEKIISTNFALQGIYNRDDRSAIQYNSLGALALMYRKWIAPALKRRYGGIQYSTMQNEYIQGYYRTAINFFGDVAKDWFAPVSEDKSLETILRILFDWKAMRTAVALNKSKMTDYELGNVKKARYELAIVGILFAAATALKNLPPDDHDGNKFLCWADDLAYTQLLRLRSEIGSQAPTPNMINEFTRIASSPFAVTRTIQDSFGIFKLLWIPNYTEKIKSGRYAGRTQAHKYFMKLPLVQLFRKFDNVIDPTDMLNYYKNQNY